MKTGYLRLVKKQRGFTLIELLAVILILGVIALIAIPAINGVVEQTRVGAVKASANQFVSSVNEYILSSDLFGEKLEDGVYSTEELAQKGLSLKGTMPDDGVIMIQNGVVKQSTFTFGNYSVRSTDDDFEVIKKEESIFNLTQDDNSNKEPNVGDKVCLDTECFYVINVSNDKVRLLAEWNLNVGYNLTYKGSKNIPYTALYNSNPWTYKPETKTFFQTQITFEDITPEAPLIRQDKNITGWIYEEETAVATGITNFSFLNNSDYVSGKSYVDYLDYWVINSNNYKKGYPVDVYDSNSRISEYVDAYVNNLMFMIGDKNITGDLIKYSELISLGCIDYYKDSENYTCETAKPWVYQTSYWTGSAGEWGIWAVYSDGYFENGYFSYGTNDGVRPVITVSKSLIK